MIPASAEDGVGSIHASAEDGVGSIHGEIAEEVRTVPDSPRARDG
jgi:hypothetical protein